MDIPFVYLLVKQQPTTNNNKTISKKQENKEKKEMNIPNAYRKAVDGFVIPPRTFWQMAVSAAQGTFSLFEQSSRSEFIENLDRGTINEGVISQATAGTYVVLFCFGLVCVVCLPKQQQHQRYAFSFRPHPYYLLPVKQDQ